MSEPRYVVLHEDYVKKVTVLKRRASDGCYAPYAHMEDCSEASILARHLNEKEA